MVNLSQLHMTENEQPEWRQKGRWIKFEEEVNEDVGRWGKPQVSSLSFHSLLELRRCIDKGTVLLDLPAPDLSNIATCVVDDLLVTGQLERTQRNAVLNALLQRHVHQSELARLHQPLSRMSSLFQRNRITPSGSFHSFTSVPLSRSASSRFSARSFAKNRLTPLHNRLKRSKTAEAGGAGGQKAPGGAPPETTGKDGLIAPDYTWSGQQQSQGGGADIVENRTATTAAYQCDCGDPNCTIGRDQVPEIEITVDEADAPTVPHVLTREEQELLNKIPVDAEATTVLVGNVDFLSSPVMAFVRLSEGRQLGNLTEVPIPVRFLFILLGPEDTGDSYHEIGRAIATLMADTTFHEAAYRAESRQDLLNAIEDFLEDSLVLPRGKYDKDLLLPAIKRQQRKRRKKELALQAAEKADQPEDAYDPLAKTGRLFGGMFEDLKRLKNRYVSDFKDGMNSQVFITIIFMYFGCIAPTIAFGSLLGEKTKHAMGLPEMIFSTALGGVIFGLLSGQPMMLIGPTGPTVVFEGVIYVFCKENGLDFFTFRLWCGIWVFAILMLIVVTDSSYLVQKFTRFTEEVFAALIAFLFIFEPLLSISHAFEKHPVTADYCTTDFCIARGHGDENLTYEQATAGYGCGNMTNMTMGNCTENPTSDYGKYDKVKNQPNTAMLYMVLLIGTFVLAYALRMLKSSKYLGKMGRRFLGDFGILVSILVFVFIDHIMFGSIYTEMIDAPSGITTSKPRDWFINPADNLSVVVIFGSSIAGFLVAFLVFVETQVTCLICCGPDHKFQKLGGYHWNLTVTSCYILVCSFFGLPWTCGTPVPSLSHTQNLLKINKNVAPGMKPIVEGAHEQRLSNTMIHVLIGLSLAPPVTYLLSQIPFAVIMGVFLYLGFCNILTLQFTQRVILMMIPPKHHPDDKPYVRHVRPFRMHLYTAIQIFWWGVLIVFKMTKAGLVFPLMVGLMIPLRDYIVARIFTEKELHALDPHGAEDGIDDDSVDIDEYETHVRL